MNVIFSRKGFDSRYGGMASPILPDGRLLPLCIPSRHDKARIADLPYVDVDAAQLISDVSNGKHHLSTHIHLDPDLVRADRKKPVGWRPALGQTGAAQSHLRSRRIGQGDLFLFFGWFRLTERVAGKWRFAKFAPDLHVLFGWLEVDEVLPIVTERRTALERHPWVVDHAHAASPDWYNSPLNTLYIGRNQSLYARQGTLGGGLFPTMRKALQLTKPGCSRSIWSLPSWFAPKGRPPLSYHPKATSWHEGNESVTLRSAAKGQEFVLNSAPYPELEAWAGNLIKENA
jgi:hypothetical protein